MQMRTFAAIVGLAALTLLSTTPVARAQATTINRPAELRNGTCVSPGDVVATLANLVVTLGDPQGQSAAQPVEQSGTVVPYLVPDLLAADHIIAVLKSPEERQVMVACGEIGGTLNPDGTLAIGMRGMNGSGLSGIAYFTPNPGFDNILITILLVGDVAASETGAVEPVR
jgi:hypothetical protein